MGLCLFAEFDREWDAPKINTTGEFLARWSDLLDEIADDFGLTPLCEFLDNRSVPDDFDGDPEELEDLMGKGPIGTTPPRVARPSKRLPTRWRAIRKSENASRVPPITWSANFENYRDFLRRRRKRVSVFVSISDRPRYSPKTTVIVRGPLPWGISNA